MNEISMIARIAQQEDLNFLLTNRIPRRLLTRLMGRVSRIENPWVCSACIALWRLFTDLDLSDAKVGACGTVADGTVLQAKGFPYPLIDLLQDPELVSYYRDGRYATLRLTSAMYHRFHAPLDCRVDQVTYVSGDTWNVNPIALARVERLFCKNERAIIRCRLPAGELLTLVPVAAVLVASIRLHFLDVLLHMRYRGPNVMYCEAAMLKGQEMGWFEHGSTIIVFAPRGFSLCENIRSGERIKMGQALMRFDAAAPGSAAP